MQWQIHPIKRFSLTHTHVHSHTHIHSHSQHIVRISVPGTHKKNTKMKKECHNNMSLPYLMTEISRDYSGTAPQDEVWRLVARCAWRDLLQGFALGRPPAHKSFPEWMQGSPADVPPSCWGRREGRGANTPNIRADDIHWQHMRWGDWENRQLCRSTQEGRTRRAIQKYRSTQKGYIDKYRSNKACNIKI